MHTQPPPIITIGKGWGHALSLVLDSAGWCPLVIEILLCIEFSALGLVRLRLYLEEIGDEWKS